MMLFGEEAEVEVRHHHGPLHKAERRLPHKAGAPAQQGAACHGPGNIRLREDVQDHIQEDPARQQRQQVPHGPAGEELLPGIDGRVGQPQHKTARDLDGLPNGPGQVLERLIMNKKVQHAGEKGGVKIGLEQGLQLLLDALADGALAEAVAAGDEKRGHERFPVNERKKGGQ